MPTPRKSKAEIPTIDCALVTVEIDGDEFGFDTSNRVQVESATEEIAAVRLVVKGILRAQKKRKFTIVGTTITLTDNVFNPDLVLALQGGTCTYDNATGALNGYTPPVIGSKEELTPFTLNCYSAQYDASGDIVNYEKISYPNCTGQPIVFSSEDDVFRAPEYVIDSAPKKGQAPYSITYVDELPELRELSTYSVTQNLTNATSSFTGTSITEGIPFNATLTATSGTLGSITVTMGGTNISTTAVTGNTISIPSVTGAIVITATAS
jgi:hypothetical protein